MDNVKEALNQVTLGWAKVQREIDRLGSQGIKADYHSLTHCTMCGEPNGDCGHGE